MLYRAKQLGRNQAQLADTSMAWQAESIPV
jgi:hypothetical protein